MRLILLVILTYIVAIIGILGLPICFLSVLIRTMSFSRACFGVKLLVRKTWDLLAKTNKALKEAIQSERATIDDMRKNDTK